MLLDTPPNALAFELFDDRPGALRSFDSAPTGVRRGYHQKKSDTQIRIKPWRFFGNNGIHSIGAAHTDSSSADGGIKANGHCIFSMNSLWYFGRSSGCLQFLSNNDSISSRPYRYSASGYLVAEN